ncbi:hypothetical protein NKJ70_05895 [Mesorhizobium sp. M0092]|uniref:hypothetical protein n=1 Tax=Mesorhizobium sp. M0092 TaxID=2956876 RepID=UPI00333C79D3
MATSIDQPDEQFKIIIEHSGAVPATDIGAILLGIDKAFGRFVRSRSGGRIKGELGVREVRHGCIEVVLEAIASVDKLLDARAYLAPFASHLIEIAKAALDLAGPTRGTKADQKLVGDIARPVANGHARQINLVIHGNPTFNITPEVASHLIERLTPPPKEATAWLHPSPLMLDEAEHNELASSGLSGTALEVDGQWYARLENGRGVLVPIFNLGRDVLVHRGVYSFQGYEAQGVRGEVVGINITGARRLDGPRSNQAFQR